MTATPHEARPLFAARLTDALHNSDHMPREYRIGLVTQWMDELLPHEATRRVVETLNPTNQTDDEERFTDDAGASHTASQCRWSASQIYPGHDACLVNPVAHYRPGHEACTQP